MKHLQQGLRNWHCQTLVCGSAQTAGSTSGRDVQEAAGRAFGLRLYLQVRSEELAMLTPCIQHSAKREGRDVCNMMLDSLLVHAKLAVACEATLLLYTSMRMCR